ncbi:hypothetical protein K4F52_009921 [Lecanicillium sp. MT-2017a]|nr:hypothetical protein K4F52_009921 [Lecanicillium sp. MT-2017a]
MSVSATAVQQPSLPASLAGHSDSLDQEAQQSIPPESGSANVDSYPATSQDPASHSYYSRQQYTEIPHPILEEEPEAAESGSESPIEPVTPVSGGRHSQDFTNVQNDDQNLTLTHYSTTPAAPTSTAGKTPFYSQSPSQRTTPAHTPARHSRRNTLTKARTNTGETHGEATTPRKSADQEQQPPPSLSRRSTRGSTSRLKRTMSSLFRRSSSAVERDTPAFESDSPGSSESYNSVFNRNGPGPTSAPRNIPGRDSTTTQSISSNSPPTPGSPLEMAPNNRNAAAMGKSLPSAEDFNKKQRAATGLTFRGRAVTFGRGGRPKVPRRASSFDEGNRAAKAPNGAKPDESQGVADKTYPPERLPWPLPPDAGSGTKARRMSLSLPDDFMIDVAELLNEFEYHQKILGRHGKHLGKGAASKVTLMARKGYPNELYAVKEFRGKSNRESQQDYENKIKSEFSIAKSLHHPNIVETVRLCTDHSRWNHVMEYCSEGDLFSLVQKGWLKGEAKLKDRLCLFKQLIQGVGYLHANGIAHRDIKLENLLITKDSKLKITDFGVSEVFSGTHPGFREAGGQCGCNMGGEVRLCSPGICGSEPYIAPEVLAKKSSYDPRALDVWSSAIIMIYLTFGGAIWSRAEAGNAHYDKLVRGWERWNERHPEPDATITETDYPKCYALDVGVNPPALRRIMLQMLHPDPAKRIGIAEVLNNRWMKNVECCQLESYDEQATTIDATKKECCSTSNKKIFCHNHLPPKMGSHSLGKMPGQAGY